MAKRTSKNHHCTLKTGEQALKKWALSIELANKLANIQAIAGFGLILNAKLQPLYEIHDKNDLSRFSIKAITPSKFLPAGCLISSDVVTADQKLRFINQAENLLSFYKNTLASKDELLEPFEKSFLKCTIQDIYKNCSKLKTKKLNLFALLNQWMINLAYPQNQEIKQFFNRCFNSDSLVGENLQESWLLILPDENQNHLFITGDTEAEFAHYILCSEFFQKFTFEVSDSVDFSQGWDQIVERQLWLSHDISEKTAKALKEYKAIQALYIDLVAPSKIVRNQKLNNLLKEKERVLNEDSTWRIFNLKQHRALDKLERQISLLRKDISNQTWEKISACELNQHIGKHIRNTAIYKQKIPVEFYNYYFETINLMDPFAMATIRYILTHRVQLAVDIPEKLIESYLLELADQIKQEDVAKEAESLSALQHHLHSPSLSRWLERAQLIIHPVLAPTAESIQYEPIKEEIAELAKILGKSVSKRKKDMQKTEPTKSEPIKLELNADSFNKIAHFIETYPVHKQSLPPKLLKHYWEGLRSEVHQNKLLNDTRMKQISILIDHVSFLKTKIPQDLLSEYLSNLDNRMKDNLELLDYTIKTMTIFASHNKSEQLVQWIADKQVQLNLATQAKTAPAILDISFPKNMVGIFMEWVKRKPRIEQSTE